MCSLWKTGYSTTSQEPDLNEWFRFIELAAELTDNSIEISVSGGEPLLDDRNLALIKFSAEKGLATSMPTNGFLIDNEMALKIADSGLSAIGISLDGINRNTHDFLRGVEGCYDKVMQAIGHLDKSRGSPKIGILTTISEKNLDEVIELARWANEDNRIETIIFQAITQPFNTPLDSEWYNRSEYSFLWPQDTKKVQDLLDELIKLKKMAYKISNSVPQLESFKRYFENPGEFIKKDICNVDFWMNINQLGDVYICSRKEAIGNIRKDTLKDMWYSAEANQRREEIKNCKANCHILVNCAYEED
jgi:MoaA/NifB/PqqE/SkfB family radical SAM enzyme